MEPFIKPLNELTIEDIEILVMDKVSEGRTLDYKRELHEATDAGNKEFLKDVSAFANTLGGYLVYGVDEEKGVPREITGVAVDDIDKLKLHFENLLRMGVEPKIRGVDFGCISYNDKQKVVVIKIPKSLSRPHMVTIKGHSRFYGRNSAGTYQLDVNDLRKLFLEADSLAVQIRNFRNNRLAHIATNETPVPLVNGAKIVLHILPESSFEIGQKYYFTEAALRDISPIGASGWNSRYNFDGFLTFCSYKEPYSTGYVQVFNNGVVEALDTRLVRPHENTKSIPSIAFEQAIVGAFAGYVSLLKKLGVGVPVWVCLALLGVKGYWMWVNNFHLDDGASIERDELIIPEVRMEDFETAGEKILKSVFDTVWNACGYERSFNYDENGNWKLRGK